MGKLEKIIEKFKQLNSSDPLVVRSPGRINLIGEHTDYNLGPVLPAAIDKSIYLAITPREDNIINIHAADFNEHHSTSIEQLEPAWKLWPNYILGVINEFKLAGNFKTGVNIVFGGDIPLAAGMSSSAAINCAITFALNQLFNTGYSRLEMAKIAQKAEHSFVGVQCGLMDQFASLYGKKDHLIKLDCNTAEYDYIPYNTENIKFILFDSGVKHFLVSSAYNDRRRECRTGVEIISQKVPNINGLPDITEEMLTNYVKPVDEIIYKRCLYVVQEIARLNRVCIDLENNNFEALGHRLYETHYGLKDLYEVSCKECDFLVDITRSISGVLGARMMGAGFGGCTLNLIYGDVADSIIDFVKLEYKKAFGKDLKVYVASLADGTSIIQDPVTGSLNHVKSNSLTN